MATNADFNLARVFCSGINGAGMSGLARILLQAGVAVVGSDREEVAMTHDLRQLGAEIHLEQTAANIDGSFELFIHSAAIREGHPEYDRAGELGVRRMKYAEMLGALTRLRKTIAIAGTHGKTSTTNLTATIFAAAKRAPSWVIGGTPTGLPAASRWDNGEYLIVEACEYDRSFLQLSPHLALLHNIEPDHMDYFGTLESLRGAFRDFAERVGEDGCVVANLDEPQVRAILPRLTRRVLTYGRSTQADLQAQDVRFCEGFISFTLVHGAERQAITLGVPGRTALPNALAASALAIAAGMSLTEVAQGLAQASTVKRRFECLASHRTIEIYDDYAHHPTSVKELAASARSRFAGKELIFIFQAHQYARLIGFFDEFVEGLKAIDRVVICPTFAARESGITPGEPEAELERVLRAAGCRAAAVTTLAGAIAAIELATLENAAIFTVGAGDVTRVGAALAKQLLALPALELQEAA